MRSLALVAVFVIATGCGDSEGGAGSGGGSGGAGGGTGAGGATSTSTSGSTSASTTDASSTATGNTGVDCQPSACGPNQVCVEYTSDGGTGTQCRTIEGTDCAWDDCECIAASLCDGNTSGVTCTAEPGGLLLQGCFFGP